jgi:hypothetical protein
MIAHQIFTVALKGSEEVSCLFDGDLKACIMAIACIDTAETAGVDSRFESWRKGKLTVRN